MLNNHSSRLLFYTYYRQAHIIFISQHGDKNRKTDITRFHSAKVIEKLMPQFASWLFQHLDNISSQQSVRTTCNKPVGSTMLLQVVLDSLVISFHQQAIDTSCSNNLMQA